MLKGIEMQNEIAMEFFFKIRTFSISWFIAHSLAIDPILFVMVTSVALAKSSLETLPRRSLPFIWPKLKISELKLNSMKMHEKYVSFLL